MDTAHLGQHMMLSRDLLEAPYQDLHRAKLVKASIPSTFVLLCVALKYSPRPFPSHRDFLERHDFATWLKRTLAKAAEYEPNQPTIKAAKKRGLTPAVPKKGRRR